MSGDTFTHRGIIETQLTRAEAAGEAIDREALRDRSGIGPNDFEVVIGVMADDGSIVVHPETGTIHLRDTAADAAQAPAEEPLPGVPEDVPDRDDEPPAIAARRFLMEQGVDVAQMTDVQVVAEVGRIIEERHAREQAAVQPQALGAPGDRRIVLTAQTAAAIDGTTLGAMVLAGMQEAQAAESRFILVVEP